MNGRLSLLTSHFLTVAERSLHESFSRPSLHSASMTLKAVLAVAIGLIGALAIGIHLYAPQLMHQLGHALHGGR
jgi:hypothetical protein